MIKLSEKLKRMSECLTSVEGYESTGVYHYKRPASVKGALIWAEDGEAESFDADNGKREQQLHGFIDYFTAIEFDRVCDDVQGKLNNFSIGWQLSSVDYEDDTGLIHFRWEWWI